MIRQDRRSLDSMPIDMDGRIGTRSKPAPHIDNKLPSSQLLLVTLHFPLGLILHFVPMLGVVQAVLVVVIGLRAASRGSKGQATALLALGYLMGAEVLWRMLNLSPMVPWEGGKYATLMIATVGIVRRYRHVREWPLIPFLYLLCLLPSMIMLLGEVDLAFARQSVIGNLAGPVALGLCSVFLAGTRLDSREFKRLAGWVLAPILSISALALLSTYTAQEQGILYFGMSSNFITSGEFGPNQVSNALALGALVCWLWVIFIQTTLVETVTLLGIMLGLAAQIFLTFSRGGAYVLGLCVLSSLVVQILNLSKRRTGLGREITAVAVGLSVLMLVVWPWVDDFTGGALARRYSAEDTNRLQIIQAELRVWKDYPILGVGPGRSVLMLRQYGSVSRLTHTEFTRLLAEHGMFGALAISLLVAGVVRNYRSHSQIRQKIWVVSVAAYTALYMAQAATRTVAPAVMYALIWTHPFADPE